ncbi:MAG TPA: NADP oxidoreductase [Bacteroidales bacterium]|nr:NADP oxidoreductase [Bacteroidales bacterium]
MIQEKRIALRNSGLINPESIDEYIQCGGYQAFAKALTMSPSDISEIIIDSGLRGRGGAGFPTGTKEKSTAQTCIECLKYIVCNADEGEPGTFKDRIIMETDPHNLIEGMLIAAWSVGASVGYIYVRGEYHLSIERLNIAIKQAEKKGFIGENILNTDFSFTLEVKPGAGSYLCGEELTLIESLEGKRGYPRIKPPFPAQKGLWDHPTLINNVETLANFAPIILYGADWYKSFGTSKSPGTKIFCLSGDVKRPGYYEVDMGITLIDLINEFGGGVNGNSIKSILIGGAAGTFASINHLNLPLDFDSLKEQGLTLGSGAVVVMNETRDLLEMLTSILDFFKHESCGKCIPCRLGTAQILNITERIQEMEPKERESTFINIIQQAEIMAKTSLCPLGQSPILPLKSLWVNFANELINKF